MQSTPAPNLTPSADVHRLDRIDHESLATRPKQHDRLIALVAVALLIVGFFSDVLSAALHVAIWTYTGALVSTGAIVMLAFVGWRTLRKLGPPTQGGDAPEAREAERAKARAEAGNRSPRI